MGDRQLALVHCRVMAVRPFVQEAAWEYAAAQIIWGEEAHKFFPAAAAEAPTLAMGGKVICAPRCVSL
jgi:hypothetical protein